MKYIDEASMQNYISCLFLILAIDECSTQQDDCHDNATCSDTDGSYTCSCNDGFTGDGFTCASEYDMLKITFAFILL